MRFRSDGDEIEVLDATSGKMELISKSDPSCHESRGYKGRRYKGTKKPEPIPTHVRRAASRVQTERAKPEAELTEALDKHKVAAATCEQAQKDIRKRLSQSDVADADMNVEHIPGMPAFLTASSAHDGTKTHREKPAERHEQAYDLIMKALVARPVGQKEINSNPAAQAAFDKEWNNLLTKGAWDRKTGVERLFRWSNLIQN